MDRIRTVFVVSVFGLPAVSMVAAADPDLAKLKSSYEAAVERATAPLKVSYERELQKLLELHTKAGNLSGALEAKAELEALSVEKLFVDKTWKTPTGTRITFEKNGAGSRQYGSDKTSLIWRHVEGNLIEAAFQSTQGGSVRINYFRFKSPAEAYYGDSRDNVGAKLELLGQQ